MLLEVKMIVELSNSHYFPLLNGESGVVVSDVGDRLVKATPKC